MKITVVGQGYVGLPLAIAAVNAGYTVYGLDNNEEKINSLGNGISIIEDLTDHVVKESINSKRYLPTTDKGVVADSEVILICVPTPLSSDHKPDLAALTSAITTVGKNLKAGTLVIVESTIEPGTCRNVLLPILIKESGLKASDFELAYSPERIDPTNKTWSINNTPKLVAGLTDSAADKAEVFYGKFVRTIIKCSSLEIAETAKLLENSFRLVNISFINELSLFCEKIGIDINDVVKAAATKPYGFMPFYPSIGVGGHCIPVDPVYLATKAKEMGVETKFLDLASQVNNEVPSHYVRKAINKLGSLENKKIIVVGVAYKPNISDVRETPVASLIDGLREAGAQVYWHDSLVKEWVGQKSVDLSSDYDLAIIATRHDNIDLRLLNGVPLITVGGKIN
jgi:UDP-N-acetyl-D-glucosamine dehydrogenase